QRLAGAAQVMDTAGLVPLAGQRAFQISDIHGSAVSVVGWVASLDLYRAMLDLEQLVEDNARIFEQFVRVIGSRRDDVGRERCLGRAQGPDVKVVNRIDSFKLSERRPDAVEVDSGGYSGKRHPDRFLQEADASPEDDDGDGDAHHG